MVTPLILPAGEYAVAEQVWQWLQGSGHAGHGSFAQDLSDHLGTVTCSCGSRFVPLGEADKRALDSAGGGA